MRMTFLSRICPTAFALVVALMGGAAFAPAIVRAQEPAIAPLTCLLAPARVSAVGTDLRSIVADVPVSRADFVAAGDLLIQLDGALAQADLDVAEITVRALEERIARNEGLVGRNLISLDEVEQLRTDLALARADSSRASLQIARTTIRAPFAGYIAQTGVAEGELTGTEPLLQLIDVSTLRAEMVFLDSAFGRFEVGQNLRIAVDLVNAEVDGIITVIDPYLDAASNTFSVVAEIENADLLLPAGASCRIMDGS